FFQNARLRLAVVRLVFGACQTYGAVAAQALFGDDCFCREDQGQVVIGGSGGGQSSGGVRAEGMAAAGYGGDDGCHLIPALVNFLRLELEDWERRRYSEVALIDAIDPDHVGLLKQAFQLLWALAMHAPLPLRDMAQGAGMFNTMVNVVSRFYNSVEMEEFQVHKEAMMLMEKMN
ncbi:unnamed protein product, partial [Hapterophycus canaliculatus]